MAFGVYKIENITNRRVYIGSTVVTFRGRWGQHKSQLGNGCHPNHYLQEDWDGYGEDCFLFSVLEVVKDKSMVLRREQRWLNEFLGSKKEMYNIRVSATAPAFGQARRPRRVFSNEEVAGIRRGRRVEEVSLRDLAERYNATESAISRICNNNRHARLARRKVGGMQKTYLVNEKDIADLRKRIPFGSDSMIIRVCVKAALKLSDEELRDLGVEMLEMEFENA